MEQAESVIGYEREIEMLETLRKQAEMHTSRWPERLKLLSVDPERYPGQVGFVVAGEPKSLAELNGIAATVTPRPDDYPQMLQLLAGYDRRTGLGDQARAVFASGNNLIVATNHADLIDIALAQAAVHDLVSKETSGTIRTGIMISKLVSLIAARVRIGSDIIEVPAVGGLGWLCHDTYLSFPRSASLERAGFIKRYAAEISNHNARVRERVKEKLDQGQMLMALAPSGTTDSEENPGTLRMGRVTNGTERLLMHDKAYTLPMAIWLGEKVVFRPSGHNLKKLTDEDSVHTMMLGIAKRLRESTGLRYYYPTLGNRSD